MTGDESRKLKIGDQSPLAKADSTKNATGEQS
jgi:hypothetical protein